MTETPRPTDEAFALAYKLKGANTRLASLAMNLTGAFLIVGGTGGVLPVWLSWPGYALVGLGIGLFIYANVRRARWAKQYRSEG